MITVGGLDFLTNMFVSFWMYSTNYSMLICIVQLMRSTHAVQMDIRRQGNTVLEILRRFTIRTSKPVFILLPLNLEGKIKSSGGKDRQGGLGERKT